MAVEGQCTRPVLKRRTQLGERDWSAREVGRHLKNTMVMKPKRVEKSGAVLCERMQREPLTPGDELVGVR